MGILLVAGGQGSRLGFEHPKGMYPIGPVTRAPLFQILLEKVLARGRAAGKPLPLYLMTSPATHAETEAYLAEKRYFGLPAEDARIFCQGTLPAVDAQTGKLLLAERGALATSPDGHGGMLAALVPQRRIGPRPAARTEIPVLFSGQQSAGRGGRSRVPRLPPASRIGVVNPGRRQTQPPRQSGQRGHDQRTAAGDRIQRPQPAGG